MDEKEVKPDSSGPADSKVSSTAASEPAGAQMPDAPPAEAVPVPELEKRVVDVLRTCYDPEIPVNIHELGLIYNVDVQPGGAVNIRMTLTSPMCPVAGSLPPEVEAKVRNVPGVTASKVEVVWDPPWTPAMMSEAAKLQLNMM
jgi:FeS assembly SUF system protein